MKLTPEELQAIADDTQNLAPSTFMKGRAKGPDVKLPPPQPAHGEPWPFGGMVFYPRPHESVGHKPEDDYERARQCVNLLAPHPDLSAVEVHSKETMDEVRAALGKALPDWAELEAGKASGDFASSMTWGDVRRIKSALAKLNPPQ